MKTEHVEAQLLAEHASVAPGKPATVGLRLQHGRRTGTPTGRIRAIRACPRKIQWTLPEGWKAGEIQWPYPEAPPRGPADELRLRGRGGAPRRAHAAGRREARPRRHPGRGRVAGLQGRLHPREGRARPRALGGRGRARRRRAAIPTSRRRARLPMAPGGWTFEAGSPAPRSCCASCRPRAPSPRRRWPSSRSARTSIEHAAPQVLTRDGNALPLEMKLRSPSPPASRMPPASSWPKAAWPGMPGRKAVELALPVVAALPGGRRPRGRPGRRGGRQPRARARLRPRGRHPAQPHAVRLPGARHQGDGLRPARARRCARDAAAGLDLLGRRRSSPSSCSRG